MIGALLTRDLRRKIEEIIQVDQADEQSVHEEITEYIATDSIRDQYAEVLKAIADAPSDPHEGVGVWISGFFGSGKRSFAKNLGYALQHDKTVMGESFATLFKQQIGDERVSNLLDSINTRMPTDVILFEVAKERDTRKVTERIAELMHTVLLRELDYAEDFDIAELEIELEAEGKLDEFVAICQKLYPQGWSIMRKGAQKLSRASAVLHNLDPITYTSAADSWSHAQRHRDAAITVSKVVERTFELMGRRRPGKALIFIIDEVGQHVARSGDKIEDLRATVEEFGRIGKNLLRARKIIAPCWVVVTSQEKLDEVVAAIDARRVDIAKLQDRFRSRVDLAPSDIREVATKRVLAKKPEAEPMLQQLFASNQGVLNAALRLERTSRRTEITASDFVQFYPYPPHYIELCIGDDAEEMAKRLAEVRDESRQTAHQHAVYWVWALTPELDELVAQVHASRTMVEKYDQLRAQNKITPEEASCLQDEKNAVFTHQSRLRDKLTQAMEQGTGLFRGVAWDAASLGKNLSEILKKLFGTVVPDLYPKLDMGARPLKGDEAELLLKTVDLKALPQVFYAGENGLGLIIQDGAKLVPNPVADVAKEVLDYLVSEHSYGNKDTRTGRALERRFGGMGYGWERDMLRLILALLFRAGSIEVTYQGNRFRNYQDPLSRVPFINNVAFRTSLFSPRDTLGLKTLTLAVQQLEDLTGEEVDVEEGAIATAFKKLAGEELEKLYPLKAAAEAYQLPVLPLITDFQQTLVGIQSSTSDDCVRLLTETGALFQEHRERIRKMRGALDDAAIRRIREARTVVYDLGPKLASHPLFTDIGNHLEALETLVQSEQLLEQLDSLTTHTKAVTDAYRSAYCDLFDQRREAYMKALEELKGHPEWQTIAPEFGDTLVAPLTARLGEDADRQGVAAGTSLGSATLAEMASDLAAVVALKAAALARLQEATMVKEPDTVIRRVRIAEVFNRPIQSPADLEDVLAQLRDALQKLLDEGAAIILE